jgi:hypothetical protein
MADAVLDADAFASVGPAFGLVRRGKSGRDWQLVPPSSRPGSDDRARDLDAQALIAGIGQQDDARGEGQQLHRAGLADLGQIMNGARAGLSAEQQPPGGVADRRRP